MPQWGHQGSTSQWFQAGVTLTVPENKTSSMKRISPSTLLNKALVLALTMTVKKESVREVQRNKRVGQTAPAGVCNMRTD